MQDYRYKAVDTASGNLLEGILNAENEDQAIEQLHFQGHLPVEVKSVGRHALIRILNMDIFGRSGISGAELATLSRELAVLLKARVNLERSLSIVSSAVGSKSLQKLTAKLLKAIREGKSLADACEENSLLLPPLFTNTVKAGEKAAALAPVFESLANHYESRQKIKETIKSNLIYPVILLITSGLSIFFLISFVLPQVQPLFENSNRELPWITQWLLGFGNLVRDYWWLILGGGTGAVVLFRYLFGILSYRQKFERFVQNLPIIGALIRDNEIARCTGTLAMLTDNGVPLNEALIVTLSTSSNSVTRSWMKEVELAVREGSSLSRSLAKVGVPQTACQLTAIGEETGKLSEMLSHIAEIHSHNVIKNTQRLLTILSPALTIFLGGIVALIVGALLATVMEINEFAF